MNVFNLEFDSLREGDFPQNELNQLAGIEVKVESVEGQIFKKNIVISIDESEDENILSLAFFLGRLTESQLMLKRL